MNLKDFLNKRKAFDDYLVKKHNLTKNLLEDNLLAFLVELGECCNEWRRFKYWSIDKQPRKERMLEEYVDGLHFLLTIANNENTEVDEQDFVFLEEEASHEAIVHQFGLLFSLISSYPLALYTQGYTFKKIVDEYILLGSMLNLSLNEIERAFEKKLQENYERQVNDY